MRVSTLTNPVEYVANEQGRVKQVKVQKMALGEPDESGRRSPVPVEGSEYLIDADVDCGSSGGFLPTRLFPILYPDWKFPGKGQLLSMKIRCNPLFRVYMPEEISSGEEQPLF